MIDHVRIRADDDGAIWIRLDDVIDSIEGVAPSIEAVSSTGGAAIWALAKAMRERWVRSA